MGIDALGWVHRTLLGVALEPAADAPALRRRRLVCLVTVLIGAAVLRLSLTLQPGDPLFYPATAGLALVWLVGGRLSGPLPLGRPQALDDRPSRGVAAALVWGVALLALFLAGGLLVAAIPTLSAPVQGLLDHARRGSLPLVALLTAVNGVGEECFFRGALFQALPARRLLTTTVVYAAVTALSGVPLLVLAAVPLGILTGLERRATGGFLSPTVTHVAWSVGMLFLLPWSLALGEWLFA